MRKSSTILGCTDNGFFIGKQYKNHSRVSHRAWKSFFCRTLHEGASRCHSTSRTYSSSRCGAATSLQHRPSRVCPFLAHRASLLPVRSAIKGLTRTILVCSARRCGSPLHDDAGPSPAGRIAVRDQLACVLFIQHSFHVLTHTTPAQIVVKEVVQGGSAWRSGMVRRSSIAVLRHFCTKCQQRSHVST